MIERLLILCFQEFNSGEPTTPGGPDEMFVKDLNPYLTRYNLKTKFKVDMLPQVPRELSCPVFVQCPCPCSCPCFIEFDSYVKKLFKISNC